MLGHPIPRGLRRRGNAPGQMRAVPYRAAGNGRAYPEPYLFTFPALDNVRRFLRILKAH